MLVEELEDHRATTNRGTRGMKRLNFYFFLLLVISRARAVQKKIKEQF